MMGQFQTEWLSANEEVSFPFRDSTRAGTVPVPSGLLTDLRLFLTGTTETEVYLSQLQYDGGTDVYTLTFCSITDDTTLLTGTLSRLTPDGYTRVFRKQSLASGLRVALLTPGPLWDTPSWNGGGSWTQSWGVLESAIETSLVNPGPQNFRRIFIDGLAVPAESEWPYGGAQKLIGGYNAEFGTGRSIPRSIASGGPPFEFMELSSGRGMGAGYPPRSSTDINYVATIQGTGPDKQGNLSWRTKDCLRMFQPVTQDAILDHRLQFGSDCSPCCPCGEYLKASRAIGRRSAKIKDLCDDLSMERVNSATIYNDAVGEINRRRQPLAVVRGVRASGSHVKFTVQNMTGLPIFAYVAFDTEASLIPLGGAVATNDYVQTVPQSGVSISTIIGTHRTSLPALPFNEAENPAATFPSAGFTDEISSLLICVGQKTALVPFSPIDPGSLVEVSLNFPTIEVLLAGFSNPLDVKASSVAGSLPTFKFRTVAVYGTSHCYACTSETYRCRVVAAAPPPDAFEDRCDAQFENDFTTVPAA